MLINLISDCGITGSLVAGSERPLRERAMRSDRRFRFCEAVRVTSLYQRACSPYRTSINDFISHHQHPYFVGEGQSWRYAIRCRFAMFLWRGDLFCCNS